MPLPHGRPPRVNTHTHTSTSTDLVTDGTQGGFAQLVARLLVGAAVGLAVPSPSPPPCWLGRLVVAVDGVDHKVVHLRQAAGSRDDDRQARGWVRGATTDQCKLCQLRSWWRRSGMLHVTQCSPLLLAAQLRWLLLPTVHSGLQEGPCVCISRHLCVLLALQLCRLPACLPACLPPVCPTWSKKVTAATGSGTTAPDAG